MARRVVVAVPAVPRHPIPVGSCDAESVRTFFPSTPRHYIVSGLVGSHHGKKPRLEGGRGHGAGMGARRLGRARAQMRSPSSPPGQKHRELLQVRTWPTAHARDQGLAGMGQWAAAIYDWRKQSTRPLYLQTYRDTGGGSPGLFLSRPASGGRCGGGATMRPNGSLVLYMSVTSRPTGVTRPPHSQRRPSV